MATIESTAYAAPGQPGSPVGLKERYENFIGGGARRARARRRACGQGRMRRISPEAAVGFSLCLYGAHFPTRTPSCSR